MSDSYKMETYKKYPFAGNVDGMCAFIDTLLDSKVFKLSTVDISNDAFERGETHFLPTDDKASMKSYADEYGFDGFSVCASYQGVNFLVGYKETYEGAFIFLQDDTIDIEELAKLLKFEK